MITVIMVVALTLFTGCGNTADIPTLSDEQTELITEYAAGLLIKYNSLPDQNLLNPTQLEEEEKKEEEQREKERKRKEAEKEYLAAQEAKEQEKANKKNGNSSVKKAEEATIDNLAAFYDMDGFAIDYTGYKLCHSYPDEERDDFFLAMEATDGKQLCILQFDVTNTNAEELDFDMFAKKPLFLLSLDGQDTIPAQSTLLLDDLAFYKGKIGAGASEQMILVFEINQDVTQPTSIELTAKNGTQKGKTKLQ